MAGDIIDEATFKRVQSTLDFAAEKDRQRTKNSESRVFLLSGIFKCKCCGCALMGSAAHGKKKVHRYYRHAKIKGEVISCPADWIPAEEVEAAVINHLDEVLCREGYLDSVQGGDRKI